MVTQDGHGPVGSVVGQDLGRNVFVRWRRTSHESVSERFTGRRLSRGRLGPGVTPTCCELLELLLQGDGGVVGTEHFGRQSVHQLLEVLVQNRSLGEGGRAQLCESRGPIGAMRTRPFASCCCCCLTLRRSNRSSSGSLFSMNSCRFLNTCRRRSHCQLGLNDYGQNNLVYFSQY